MSTEYAKALIKHYQPAILAQRAESIVRREWDKGCTPRPAPGPVELEPPFEPMVLNTRSTEPSSIIPWIQAPPIDPNGWQRLQAWVSPEQEGDWWNSSERFLKQLSRTRHRIGFELLGNRKRIDQLVFFHQQDDPQVRQPFLGEFERCRLTPATWIPHAWRPGRGVTIHRFWDFYPAPPYFRLFTRPEELRGSIYGPIVSALTTLPPEAFGLVQVLFQAVHPQHNWHDNVRRLTDMEYELKQVVAWNTGHLSAHHPPTGYIGDMADSVNAKAHNDKPFFFVALRLAIGGIVDDPDVYLAALATFVGMLQQGGRPLECVSQTDYRRALPDLDFTPLLATGQTYRPGFLLNSEELTTLAHFCPPAVTEHRPRPLKPLEPLAPSKKLRTGIQIGVCAVAGRLRPVCIPLRARAKHLHVIGRPGCGKSCLLQRMILQEIERGHGVALLDPHGSLVQDLLDLIPPAHAERVIYLRPADPAYVPLWNPLHCGPGLDPGRVTADLVKAVHAIVQGWGDRLAHLLRHAFFALLHLPGTTLQDVADLLARGSPESDALIRVLTNGPVANRHSRQFWTQRFRTYGNQELGPPQHKLSTLLMGGHSVSLMLSQPESRFNLREIMDEGQILLVDLAGLGIDVRDTLGCFMLALLYLTAIGRLDDAGKRPRPFHVYCDEAHHFITESIDEVIAETRKFEVSLTLAHQFMRQFDATHASALSSVGSTIVFEVNQTDAGHLKENFLDRVTARDLIRQGRGEAIARISTDDGPEIVRLRTLGPVVPPETSYRDLIIARSRERYYLPIEVVQRQVEAQQNRWLNPPRAASVDAAAEKEASYEEL